MSFSLSIVFLIAFFVDDLHFLRIILKMFAISILTAEDDIVKQTFVNQQTQFRGFLKELSKVPIPLDPRDSKAVAAYAESLKSIRVRSSTDRL